MPQELVGSLGACRERGEPAREAEIPSAMKRLYSITEHLEEAVAVLEGRLVTVLLTATSPNSKEGAGDFGAPLAVSLIELDVRLRELLRRLVDITNRLEL